MTGVRLEGVTAEIPVGTIYCVGRNYRAHALEMGSEVPDVPIIFTKPAGAILREGEPIRLPGFSKDVHHEVELVVLIGMEGKDVPRAEAMDYVIGYGVGLDLTARDLQREAKRQGLPWTISKGFDGSAPLSRFVPASSVADPQQLQLALRVNDVLRQNTATDRMIFTVADLIAYLSTIFTLRSGDLIFTGTPEGVGPLQPGDRLELYLGPAGAGSGPDGGLIRGRFDVALP